MIDIQSPIGIGELRLLLPNLLARQSNNDSLLLLIAAPMQINSEMLAEYGFKLNQILVIKQASTNDVLWCAEQCLRSGCCHIVLMWRQSLEIAQVKRLQLAAQKGDALQIIFRQQQHSSLSLPVSLALKCNAHPKGLNVQITKRKSGWPSNVFCVDMHDYWPELTIPSQVDNVLPFPNRNTQTG
jgi:cell division inhibitor SulA